MNPRTLARFGTLIAAGGIGTYLGLAGAGLVAVAAGDALTNTSWLTAVPGLALLGAAVGPIVARLSHRWLAPQLRRRRMVLAAIGAGSLPLVTAIGQWPSGHILTMGCAAAGWVITVRLYRRHGGRARTAARQPQVPAR